MSKLFHDHVLKCSCVYTFVYTEITRVVRASITLRGIQHGAGHSVCHFGRGSMRNVVIPKRVPMKFHIHYLEESYLIIAEMF